MTSFHPRTSISIIIQVIQDDGAISLLLSFSLLFFFPSFFLLFFLLFVLCILVTTYLPSFDCFSLIEII